jgi:hypothetical protein
MHTILARRGLAAAALLTLAIGIPVSAEAAKPPKTPPGGGNTGISIAASPNPVVFGRSTTVSGRLNGQTAAVPVEIQTNPYPYAGFKTLKTVASDAKGNYSSGPLSFLVNTKVRAVAHTAPPRTSGEVFVTVRMRLTLSVGDSTPRRGQRVRFSGLAFPQHDGRTVYIQRRSATGSYVTVAKTKLADNGDQSSKFSRRVRVFRDGVFRVKVTADADHGTGVSPRRNLRVH